MSTNFKQCSTVAEATKIIQSLTQQQRIDLFIALSTVDQYVGMTMFAEAIRNLLELELRFR